MLLRLHHPSRQAVKLPSFAPIHFSLLGFLGEKVRQQGINCIKHKLCR